MPDYDPRQQAPQQTPSGHGSMYPPQNQPRGDRPADPRRNPDPDPRTAATEPNFGPDFDPYSHLGGEQGREPHRNTNGDHASYIGGPGSGSYGYGRGGHGYSGPEDRGMNRDAASRDPGREQGRDPGRDPGREQRPQNWSIPSRPHSAESSNPGSAFAAGYNQQLHRGEAHRPGFSHDFESFDRPGAPYPGPHTGKGPRNYQRPDSRILEDVCELMTQHGQLDASDVEVTCEKGELTLSGTVPDRAAKRLAEEIAETVPGVKDIHNQIRVRKPDEKSRATT